LVVVGDAHLGREPPETERAFLAFLEAVPELGDGLLVAGDLFEFWFAWRRAVPRRGTRVVARLATLRARIPVLFVGGNHDRWGGEFWEREVGIEFAPRAARFTAGRRSGLVLHGDGVAETHWSARLLGRVTSHRLTIGAFRLVHPDLACWAVDRLSGVLGDATRDPGVLRAAAQRQRAWAVEVLRREPELDLIVMGHTHIPAAEEIEPGRWYLNPGAWRDGYRYAVIEGGTARLAAFA
jgi:UDP-2,3-diacylglucosamine hydrolase